MNILNTIKGKLIISFGIIVLITLTLGVSSFLFITTVNSQYNSLILGGSTRVNLLRSIQLLSAQVDARMNSTLYNLNNQAAVLANDAIINDLISQKEEVFALYHRNVNDDALIYLEIREELRTYINNYIRDWENFVIVLNALRNAALVGDLTFIDNNIAEYERLLEIKGRAADEMYAFGEYRVTVLSDSIISYSYMRVWFVLGLTVLTVIMSVILTYFALRSILKPIKALQDKAMKLASGDLSVNLRTNERTELGVLSNAMASMAEPVILLTRDLLHMEQELENGSLSIRLPANNYVNDYKKAVDAMNRGLDILIDDNILLLDIFRDYADGDFSKTMKQLPGESAVFNEVADKMQKELISINDDVMSIINAARQGDLSFRLDTTRHTGDWNKLIMGLNDVLEAFGKPLDEAAQVLKEISKGVLKVKVEGDYAGDFALIKNSINNTVEVLNTYIDEISNTLATVSQKDLTPVIMREYLGDFSSIKHSINGIINNFNQVIEEIESSSMQIATGVTHISDTSMSLAQGSTEQSSAVESLNLLIENMLEQIQNSAENATKTNELAILAKESANTGNEDMKAMLVSMEDINTSSENISKIIKVIDDIAFQTNLLALNAAVEAARAGEHGRGFAVVAEEVRALAQRSKDAAAETTSLIQASIEKTGFGSKIANKTAGALGQIVNQVNDISTLISSVSEAGTEQVAAINNVSASIMQISQVTQANTATAEESASITQELNSQTETFRSMVSEFKLKKV